MKKIKKDTKINTNDLPQNEVFKRKEPFQHPQPAQQGPPLNPAKDKQRTNMTNSKEEQKTSKQEGLNEERSQGKAGAFEGFEDQGKDLDKR